MRGLASALELAHPSQLLPNIGPRLVLHGRAAFLSLDGCWASLRVPVSTEWSRLVTDGAAIAVGVGFDPLLPSTPLAAVRAYVSEGAQHGRLFLGKTQALPARRFSGVGGPPV
ncbi:hypothetical protein QCN29_02345 [Streptomyces sp. HNM0663]|uniref:Uncharacterized protein n=1 Tax=Streptomyces chengmaiensis TaxID=3040919 RepID=A0ABT6HH24_9ACTN|nr:hypothetical protein [Streptomyces chengmaiensis]MDH2387646.1 hypothetical protein [Streptomyces chengmaiensis]